MSLRNKLIDWSERGLIPDVLVRMGIRNLLAKRLLKVSEGNCEQQQHETSKLMDQFSLGPIAPLPEKANEQHYEVGAGVFKYMLGQRFKYSCCSWDSSTTGLDEAEENALQITCERAGVQDGMKILELGCGWGSLTIWMAEKFPKSYVTAVSNSASQREYILALAKSKGLDNRINVLTCDMNDFETKEKFDRVVSVEMFEHMRNYRVLMESINDWLRPDGKLFVHIFCNRDFTYEFHDRSEDDWMSRYFFAGGVMPSDDLLLRFQEHLGLERQWRWSGVHYQKTADAWIANMDRNKVAIHEELTRHYGDKEAHLWFNRWRMFYMACSELFGYQRGEQWWVSHYLFRKSHNRIRKNDQAVDCSAASND